MPEKKDDLQAELNALGAWLPAKSEQHRLQTPEGYFEHLEDAVFQRLEAEGLLKRSTERSTRPRWHIGLRLAAAAAAILALIWFARVAWAPAAPPVDPLEITATDIEAYLRENPELIEPQALNTALAEGAWQTTASDDLENNPSWELFLRDLSPEEMEQFPL